MRPGDVEQRPDLRGVEGRLAGPGCPANKTYRRVAIPHDPTYTHVSTIPPGTLSPVKEPLCPA